MTKPNYTHLTLVVDRSGSMRSMQSDAEGGINTLLDEQFAEDGELTVTLVEFDNLIDTVVRMTDAPLTYNLVPRGSTALLDAVGAEIVRTGENLASLSEEHRPEQVLFVVVTDGHENASREYQLEAVRNLIAQQRNQYNWVFQFLGADDAAWQGERLGMKASAYARTGKGQSDAYLMLNTEMKEVRRLKKQDFDMPDVIPDDIDGQDQQGQSA